MRDTQDITTSDRAAAIHTAALLLKMLPDPPRLAGTPPPTREQQAREVGRLAGLVLDALRESSDIARLTRAQAEARERYNQPSEAKPVPMPRRFPVMGR